MPHRLFAAVLVATPVLVVPFAIVAIAACGGSDSSTFPPSQPDAGTLTQEDSATPILVEGVDASDAAAACTPAPLGSSYQSVWKKPASVSAGKCDATQIQGFYTNCLGQPVTGTACTSFLSANADCGTCLQSDDTDSTYGPLIWHANRAYYTLNTAGCIATEQKDDSATSCGAAYQAVVQCEETACNACGVADYPLFPTCEKNAGTECSSYLTTLQKACGADLKDAADPSSVCTSATSTEQAWTVIAPIFCGAAQ